MQIPIRALNGFAIDTALWFSLTCVFLFLMSQRFSANEQIIGPHLLLASILLFTVQSLRLLIASALPAKFRCSSSFIFSASLLAISALYGLILLGLATWGKVISARMALEYLANIKGLLTAVGISPLTAASMLLAILTTIAVPIGIYSKKFNWTQSACSYNLILSFVFSFVSAGTLSIVFVNKMQNQGIYWAREGEPISLLFNPTFSIFQHNAIDSQSARLLDQEADQARSIYQPIVQSSPKNLIFVVVDALRPDHMGVYGYHRNTTPALADLISNHSATVVPALHASCAESACGLLSLAASKFVHQFSDRPFTLQEAVRRNGYKVHLILSGDHTNFYGLKQLYGQVDSYVDASGPSTLYVNDDATVLKNAKNLARFDGTPTMFQFHLMSAHGLGARGAPPLAFEPATSYLTRSNRELVSPVSPDQSVANHYDNGVLKADSIIGELIDVLREKGYLNNALVVVTADHGEALGEHGFYIHANSVFEQTLKIPLILVSFGQGQVAIDVPPVPLQVDVAPTILKHLGLNVPVSWVGVPLQEKILANTAYFQQGQELGILTEQDGRLIKYWINHSNDIEYAFAVDSDPSEARNLIGSLDQSATARWRAQLSGMRFP